MISCFFDCFLHVALGLDVCMYHLIFLAIVLLRSFILSIVIRFVICTTLYSFVYEISVFIGKALCNNRYVAYIRLMGNIKALYT
jgi:hypothetical protein